MGNGGRFSDIDPSVAAFWNTEMATPRPLTLQDIDDAIRCANERDRNWKPPRRVVSPQWWKRWMDGENGVPHTITCDTSWELWQHADVWAECDCDIIIGAELGRS